ILFDSTGHPWHCSGTIQGGKTCTGTTPPISAIFGADGLPLYQYFLNFDANDGRVTPAGCIANKPNGDCTIDGAKVRSDGNDVVFGDLGNDWLVGGTGMDTLWGGWGNDLMNADDDLAGCQVAGETTAPYDAT